MPHHIKSKGALGSGDIYYKADDTWTQVYADRKQYSNKSDADAQAATQETKTMKTPSGEVVSLYTYKTAVYANATVVTE
tara:strand:+ start:281 stop:517 length:237 start_codon:yes stop_codon:yes gene_type:complete